MQIGETGQASGSANRSKRRNRQRRMSKRKRSWLAQKRYAAWCNNSSGTRTLLAPNQRGSDTQWAARRLAELCGSLGPSQIAITHINTINGKILSSNSPFTRTCRAAALRRVIRVPCLATSDKRPHAFRMQAEGRAATQRNGYIRGANEGVEAGIAVSQVLVATVFRYGYKVGNGGKARPCELRQGPPNADVHDQVPEQAGTPVTEELALILDTCTDSTLPFVGQLSRGYHAYFGWELKAVGRPMKAATLRENFKKLKEKCGIERDLRPHDLRRTTAKAMYDLTHDLRAVQALLGHSQMSSTLWYLVACDRTSDREKKRGVHFSLDTSGDT